MSFFEELISQHLNPNRPKSMEGDIIDLLLQLRKEQSTSTDLTLDNIKAIFMVSNQRYMSKTNICILLYITFPLKIICQTHTFQRTHNYKIIKIKSGICLSAGIDTDGLPGLIMNKKNALCLVPKNYLYT
ncbi:hypothetical protein H5410_013495 [Solanum commersonii]|uniref:Uncharacterized protein n=1 Tax=Solanum commersonii TaxID=4109 RepID=A0A9J6AUN2_SOLCO|nr:hypothetical protein H5410_013495 [Solanum commersonii]